MTKLEFRTLNFFQSAVPQERIGVWFATAEIPEDIHRMSAAALRQNCVAEPTARGSDGLFIIQARFFERPKGIRTQHFCPFVAVIASRISACEDVLKRAQEAALREWWQQTCD